MRIYNSDTSLEQAIQDALDIIDQYPEKRINEDHQEERFYKRQKNANTNDDNMHMPHIIENPGFEILEDTSNSQVFEALYLNHIKNSDHDTLEDNIVIYDQQDNNSNDATIYKHDDSLVHNKLINTVNKEPEDMYYNAQAGNKPENMISKVLEEEEFVVQPNEKIDILKICIEKEILNDATTEEHPVLNKDDTCTQRSMTFHEICLQLADSLKYIVQFIKLNERTNENNTNENSLTVKFISDTFFQYFCNIGNTDSLNDANIDNDLICSKLSTYISQNLEILSKIKEVDAQRWYIEMCEKLDSALLDIIRENGKLSNKCYKKYHKRLQWRIKKYKLDKSILLLYIVKLIERIRDEIDQMFMYSILLYTIKNETSEDKYFKQLRSFIIYLHFYLNYQRSDLISSIPTSEIIDEFVRYFLKRKLFLPANKYTNSLIIKLNENVLNGIISDEKRKLVIYGLLSPFLYTSNYSVYKLFVMFSIDNMLIDRLNTIFTCTMLLNKHMLVYNIPL